MSKPETAAQKARRAARLVVTRIRQRQESRCRDCRGPSHDHVRCAECSRRHSAAHHGFSRLNDLVQQRRPGPDRRWNGHPAQTLQWSLLNHRYCEEVEA